MGYFSSVERMIPSGIDFNPQDHSRVIMVVIALYLCFVAILRAILRSFYKKVSSLPPGPNPLPVIGNIHQTPATKEPIWNILQRWHRKYGPIISVRYGSRTIISLGSYDVARDIIQRRSEKYGSRPWSVIAEYFVKGLHTALIPSGSRWKLHHRFHTRILNSSVAQSYEPLLDIESAQVLQELLLGPDGDKFPVIFCRYAYSLTWALAYGERLESSTDQRLRNIVKITQQVNEGFQNPLFLFVEMYPFLNWLPYPLAPWKRQGRTHFAESKKFFQESAEKGLKADSWNWVKDAMQRNHEYGLSNTELSFVVGSLVDASINTSYLLEFFVLACVLNPDAVKRAQEEMDNVIGHDRLPAFRDEPFLPFVRAFIREVQRWRPITPLNVPHASIMDDEYNGYKIPKDTTMLINEWAMNHDQQLFADPDIFRPERWLNDASLSTYSSSAFGFGKRTCPGQHIGRRSLFINISRILWAFNIYLKPGGTRPVETTGSMYRLTSGPKPFEASFEPRSPQKLKVMHDSWSSMPKTVGNIPDSSNKQQSI